MEVLKVLYSVMPKAAGVSRAQSTHPTFSCWAIPFIVMVLSLLYRTAILPDLLHERSKGAYGFHQPQ